MGTRRECRWTKKQEPGVSAAGLAMKHNSVRARWTSVHGNAEDNMRIEDFLSRLEPRQKKQDSRGNYICRCPAHDDKTESLHVRLGESRRSKGIILVKCFAGCDRLDILRAMGLEERDLTVEPSDEPPFDGGTIRKAVPTYEKRKKSPHPSASPPPSPQGEGLGKAGSASPQGEGKKADHGKKTLEKTYPYTDEDGRLLYEACRYRYEDGTKTFRQRRPNPDKPGDWLWDMKDVRLVLYRLPEVRKAIAAHRCVWIAEGEKDADNLAALGLCGTSAPMGAGKWNRGNYSDSLIGATCYILPDNDEPGWQHARDIAQALDGKAAHARILDLKRIWPEIPAKNDVSDLIFHLGSDKAKELLLNLARDNSVQYADLEGLYAKIPGYQVFGGRVCQSTENGPKPLCNFLALPTGILTLDDGITVQKRMEIRGWTASGKELRPARVPVGNFPGMGWVTENWDIAANISPGNTVKDKLRYVIAEVGRMTVERRTEYTHTGWRRIGGQWAYLHGGGAVGAENVNTSLEGALEHYRLDDGGHTALEGWGASQSLLTVMSEHVAVPLLSAMYLSPLRSFLQSAGIPPGFAVFFVGKGGGRKTTAASLGLSHFGRFTSKTPTASFHDTANSVRRKAFTLKDMPLLIDDYHPTSSMQERRRMEGMAQELARAFGDNTDRGRMNADRTLQAAMPPRCLAVMTGEDMPQIGESGLARFFVVRVQGKDVPITDALTQAQDMAADGYMQAAMKGYIQWLLKQADGLEVNLKNEWMKLRAEARRRLPKTSHARNMEAIAHLMLGWEMMLMYGYALGTVTKETLPGQVERAWAQLIDAGEQQTEEALEDTPENAFLDCVRELLGSKGAFVRDLGPNPEQGPSGGPGMIGYKDEMYYLLMPDLCFRAVNEVYLRQGSQFPLSKRGILRALKEAGYTETDGSGVTKIKRVLGRSMRLLWIRRHRIDGGDPPAEQQGFLDVTGDEDNPF